MDRLLRMPEVMRRVGLQRSTIYAHIKKRAFPPQEKMGSASGWRESVIDAYVSDPQGWVSRQSSQPRPAS